MRNTAQLQLSNVFETEPVRVSDPRMGSPSSSLVNDIELICQPVEAHFCRRRPSDDDRLFRSFARDPRWKLRRQTASGSEYLSLTSKAENCASGGEWCCCRNSLSNFCGC